MKNIQKYSLAIYLVIPIISVCLCRLLRIAQGEKNEEIAFGLMLGLVLDLILHIIGNHDMKRVKDILSAMWFSCVSVASPLCIGIIYMNLTGHGKGYGYDMGSEADIAAFFGAVLLVLWLLAFLPVTISLCRKCYHKKKRLVCLPLLAFVILFVIGICLLGWDEFIGLFGYNS